MSIRTLSRLFLGLATAAGLALSPATVSGKAEDKMGDIASTVARMLESAHYNRQQLNREV